MLLNNNKKQRQNKNSSKSEKFPLLLSSGSRQNYTLGTEDEGVLALRTLYDVKCLVCTLLGGDSNILFDTGGGEYPVGNDGVQDRSGKHKKKKEKQLLSAADRVLARASDRALGVVVSIEHTQEQHQSSSITSSHGKKRSQRDWDSISCVVVNSMTSSKQIHHEEEEEDDDDGFYSLYATKGSSSLVDWLSEPLRKTTNEMKDNTQDIKEAESKVSGKETSPVCSGVDKASVSTNTTTKEKIGDSKEYEDDIEDGFIGL